MPLRERLASAARLADEFHSQFTHKWGSVPTRPPRRSPRLRLPHISFFPFTIIPSPSITLKTPLIYLAHIEQRLCYMHPDRVLFAFSNILYVIYNLLLPIMSTIPPPFCKPTQTHTQNLILFTVSFLVSLNCYFSSILFPVQPILSPLLIQHNMLNSFSTYTNKLNDLL